MRLAARVCTWTLGLVLLIPAANADAITNFPFTGTGSQSSVIVHFQISGDDFLYTLGTTEGPFVVALCPNPGSSCTFQQNYVAGIGTTPDRFGITAILDGLESHAATGTLSVKGTLTTPETGSFETTVPILFTANINALGAREAGFPPLFTVALTGTGSADLQGFVQDQNTVVINQAQYTFSGTATAKRVAVPEGEIPEPGTVLLTSGGLGLLGMLVRRRRATQA
jgi:hypothetical protein